ncbi:hypothetical protein AMTR_s00002p00248970 [Amborella trichopoda]|uniref:Jacalin-type lectin domain-containing protein n=1 Tax=Amborella trichopoda TaxID=13333 RepID=W1NUH1_AMBTC|nr:hypothetical protein AMTR_s00002p00248970 [Amborella trichopoda]
MNFEKSDSRLRMCKVKLDYLDETIMSLSGHFEPKLMRSPSFSTNRRTSGPYGLQIGTPFSFSMTDGKVVGFHGRASDYLNAMGLNIMHVGAPSTKSYSLEQDYETVRDADFPFHIVLSSREKGPTKMAGHLLSILNSKGGDESVIAVNV